MTKLKGADSKAAGNVISNQIGFSYTDHRK